MTTFDTVVQSLVAFLMPYRMMTFVPTDSRRVVDTYNATPSSELHMYGERIVHTYEDHCLASYPVFKMGVDC